MRVRADDDIRPDRLDHRHKTLCAEDPPRVAVHRSDLEEAEVPVVQAGGDPLYPIICPDAEAIETVTLLERTVDLRFPVGQAFDPARQRLGAHVVSAAGRRRYYEQPHFSL